MKNLIIHQLLEELELRQMANGENSKYQDGLNEGIL
jgi:hypothetical protein